MSLSSSNQKLTEGESGIGRLGLDRRNCSVRTLCVARFPIHSEPERINTHFVPSFAVSSTAVKSDMLKFELTGS